MKRIVLCAALSLLVLAAPGQAVPSRQAAGGPDAATAQPKDAMEWFTHAADRLDIRSAGSAAFYLRATFHAYQGIDFSPPGQSTMITGTGTYEEWWVSPEKWRREVSLGSYHALEVMDGGVRKLQESADYEPNRVLMLLRALELPISPHILNPDPQQKRVKWKLEQMPDDLLQRTRISEAGDKDGWGPAYQFLPDGTLVRLEDGGSGLVTTWRNQTEFAGKQVPQHIAIGGEGLGREMLSADLQIEPLGKVDEAQFQLPGPAADAGETLRAIDGVEATHPKATHIESPLARTSFLPVGVRISAMSVVDRNGVVREAEVSGIQDFGQPLNRDQVADMQSTAQIYLESVQKNRYHPAEVGGHPCEFLLSSAIQRGYKEYAGDHCTGVTAAAEIYSTFAFSLPQWGSLRSTTRERTCCVSQTVFVLEDDADIARLIQHHLEAAGYPARLYSTPANLIPDAERQAPALFLLDIMVPGGDGLDVCRRLRAHPALSTVPIIFVTARAAENDRVLGLELGADDYVTKPFAPRELLARVKAVLRRFERPVTPSVITFEDVEIDASAMQLKVRGSLTTTTATEFRLLDYLARHPGRVFSRDHLLDAVWGDARFVTPRSVDVYVRRIREKIESDPENPRYLKTVRGAGYRFEVPRVAERAAV